MPCDPNAICFQLQSQHEFFPFWLFLGGHHFEMHPSIYFRAVELHTIWHIGISCIFVLQTCTKLICLSILTLHVGMCGNILVCAVEVLSGRRHPRSLQVHCQFLFQSVSFLKSQFEMWLQLIVIPQRPFQTNDVGTTSSKAWQHYPKYLAAITCPHFSLVNSCTSTEHDAQNTKHLMKPIECLDHCRVFFANP